MSNPNNISEQGREVVNSFISSLSLYSDLSPKTLKEYIQKEENKMEKQIIAVEGMSCPHCEMAVQQALMNLDGVKKVKASWKKKQVTVKMDLELVSIDKIKETINETGFQA
ncbi:MAG: cation transporter [Oscillospiraceae bacterium]|nr:cation transporter [Oscillospiraceae bacterium]